MKERAMCEISVVTSVYNAKEYIGETIESVQNQTFDSWEFIIIDDCSSDGSGEVIKRYADNDDRIRYICNKQNAGQCANLNKGIKLATGKYIARLDHDDLCMPDRFERQYRYMENHPDVGLIGCRELGLKNGKIKKIMSDTAITTAEEMRFSSLFFQPMGHSSFFIRRETMENNNIWYGQYDYAEDYALICDLIGVGKVERMDEHLVVYRYSPTMTSKTTSEEIKNSEIIAIQKEYLKKIGYEKNSSIICEANEGKLAGYKRTREFEKALSDFAEFCGVSVKRNEINQCVKDAFLFTLLRQKGDFGMAAAYFVSGLRQKGWLPDKRDIRMLIKGVIGR